MASPLLTDKSNRIPWERLLMYFPEFSKSKSHQEFYWDCMLLKWEDEMSFKKEKRSHSYKHTDYYFSIYSNPYKMYTAVESLTFLPGLYKIYCLPYWLLQDNHHLKDGRNPFWRADEFSHHISSDLLWCLHHFFAENWHKWYSIPWHDIYCVIKYGNTFANTG